MHKFTPLGAALLMALSAGAYAATDLQKCGAANGKAAAAVFDAIGKGGAKACAQGEAQNALEVPFTPAAKAAGAINLKASQGIDKYGEENCTLLPDSASVAVVAGLMQDFADLACSAVVN
jgi:hypothetical protein